MDDPDRGDTMNKIKLVWIYASLSFLFSQVCFAEDTKEITGAGATFPYPLYSKWAAAYQKATGVKLNYQPLGSGAGIKQIEANTVDFGSSDMPLKSDELKKNNLFQFPAVIGGVVIVYNLKDIKAKRLKITPEILVEIFLGKITKWDDPKIVQLNPQLKLPDQTITVIHRSDGSGTTFLFTNYLSKVSQEWKKKVGSSSSVAWPAGVGGKGNEGVAGFTKTIDGSIGYVEYAYAKQNKLDTIALKNRSGTFLSPSPEAFQAATSKVDWRDAADLYLIFTDQIGKDSWPITGATYILLHKIEANPGRALAVMKFFDWSYTNGDKMAKDLDYVPLPENLKSLILKAWKDDVKTKEGKKIWSE